MTRRAPAKSPRSREGRPVVRERLRALVAVPRLVRAARDEAVEELGATTRSRSARPPSCRSSTRSVCPGCRPRGARRRRARRAAGSSPPRPTASAGTRGRCRRRARAWPARRQRLERVVDLEEQSVRQAGARPRSAGRRAAAWPRRCAPGARWRRCRRRAPAPPRRPRRRRRGGGARTSPRGSQRVRAGLDRAAVEVAPEVVRERVDRGVAPLGLLAQRLQHDRVEVARAARAADAGAAGARARREGGAGIARRDRRSGLLGLEAAERVAAARPVSSS